jgi:hypothetical protein
MHLRGEEDPQCVVALTVVGDVAVGAPFYNNREDYNWVERQLCGKNGHTMMKHFDCNYTGEEKSATAATSYDIDNSWYADSGATDHITDDLKKLIT